MAKYISLQCSVCRRTKDILQDNLRALPNQCVITKGCRGSLYKIGETVVANPVLPVTGLTDWYPRGQKVIATPVTKTPEKVSLSCSASGTLTMAILLTDVQAAAHPNIRLRLRQRLSADVPFVEYVFNLAADEQIISGRDSTGKNLRFDQIAIDDGRVRVLVNGVARSEGDEDLDYQASPNVINFNTTLEAGDIVTISVFGIAPTTTQSLQFTANYSFISTVTIGAWGNIRWVDEYDPSTGQLRSQGGKKWWLYSCSNLTDLSIASLLNVVSVDNQSESEELVPGVFGEFTDVRFMLASPPFGPTDRYLGFYADVDVLSDPTGLLTSVVTNQVELVIDQSALVELYPPFQLIQNENALLSSYVSEDVHSTDDAATVDEADERLKGTKVIGPL